MNNKPLNTVSGIGFESLAAQSAYSGQKMLWFLTIGVFPPSTPNLLKPIAFFVLHTASFLRQKTFKTNPAAGVERSAVPLRRAAVRHGRRKIIARERGRIEPKKQYSFLKLEPPREGYQLHRNEIVFSAR